MDAYLQIQKNAFAHCAVILGGRNTVKTSLILILSNLKIKLAMKNQIDK